MHANERHNGFVTIASVLMLLAVAVAAALVAFQAAWNTSDSQIALLSSLKARALADACAEHARANLWDDPLYVGSESLSFETGQCAVLPIVVSSSSREVFAEGVSGISTSRVSAEYLLSVDASGSVGELEVLRYDRVADF